jgi:hypothetical protein
MIEKQMKKRVKMTESIAVMADPRPVAELDRKYETVRQNLLRKDKPPSRTSIEETINTLKKQDRYGEPILGFPRDRGFKPDQEALIDADLAVKWEIAGICVILEGSMAA